MFSLKFNPPQNFAAYRQSELDKDRVATFQAMEAFPYISKRFALQRFLGLSEEEIVENEKLWKEERDEPELTTTQGQDLRAIGITPGGLEQDIATGEELASMPAPGAEMGNMPGTTGATPPVAPATGVPPVGGGM